MASPDAKPSGDGRLSSALDRLKRLVREEGAADDPGHVSPRNVEEAVGRLKSKVGDKSS